MTLRRTTIRQAALALCALVAAVARCPGTASAQAPPDTAAAPMRVSPGGAFARAMLVPGWGHASLGTYNRAGFYFAIETVTGYTLLRTLARLGEARDRLGFREDVLRADLAGQGVTDPTEIDDALAGDATVSDLRGLVEARERQREDLIAFGIFLIFLSGVDAFVSGHLANFPEPLEVEAGQGARAGMEVALKVSLPR